MSHSWEPFTIFDSLNDFYTCSNLSIGFGGRLSLLIALLRFINVLPYGNAIDMTIYCLLRASEALVSPFSDYFS